MIEPAVSDLLPIRRRRFKRAINEAIAWIKGMNVCVLPTAEMLRVVAGNVLTWKARFIDPALMIGEKNKIGRERNRGSRSQPMDNPAEVMHEKLFSQSCDASIVFIGRMKRIRVVTGAAKSAEHD